MGDENVYSEEEKRKLNENLVRLATDVHHGVFSSSPLTTALACELHRELFAGVRDHAGRHRRAGWGTEHLEFGPNRSSHRNDVERELDELFREVGKTVASCEANPDSLEYERAAFYIAVYLHARFVQTHPFQDGNGRTSRLMMNVVLIRLALRPVAAEVPKDEYNACMNRFFRGAPVDIVIDLLLPCRLL